MSELDYMSVAQAAAALHISERAVRHRIKVGTLNATKMGPGTAAYIITRVEVDRVMAEQVAR